MKKEGAEGNRECTPNACITGGGGAGRKKKKKFKNQDADIAARGLRASHKKQAKGGRKGGGEQDLSVKLSTGQK